MRYLLSVLFICSFVSISAQKGNVDMVLFLKKSDKTPLAHEEVILTGKDNKKIAKKFSNSRGYVTFSVEKQKQYDIRFNDIEAYTRIVIPKKSPKEFSLVIIRDENLRIREQHFLTPLEKYDIKDGKYSILSLQVVNDFSHPIRNQEVTFYNGEGNEFQQITDDNGFAEFTIKPGETCYYSFKGSKKQHKISNPYNHGLLLSVIVNYTPYLVEQVIMNDTIFQKVPAEQTATVDEALVKAKVTDFKNKPLKNEKFILKSKTRNKYYYNTTDENGMVRLMVPKGDMYYFNFEFDENIDSVYYKKNSNFRMTDIRFKTIGSEKMKQRIHERELAMKRRDSLYTDYLVKKDSLNKEMARKDSLYKIEKARQDLLYKVYLARKDSIQQAHIAMKDSILKAEAYRDSLEAAQLDKKDFIHQLELNVQKEVIKQRIAERAMEEKEMLEQDTSFFVKAGYEISSVLYRMRNKWKQQIIVCDLTGSMYEYMDQLLVWQMMKLVSDDKNVRIFFNDGDDKLLKDKIIGNTGGIYATKVNTVDSTLGTMYRTILGGNGAEGPENDIEALINGKKFKNRFNELILIADNYSDVRDIDLLTNLNVPVRIILCGVNKWIHEQYLEIAYKTNGSVHTIEHDIFELSKYIDGDEIKIGKSTYYIDKGRFYLKKGA